MTFLTSCLIRSRLTYRSFYRYYANSSLRTIDIHAIPQEPNQFKPDQPFRTTTNDPVCKFS